MMREWINIQFDLVRFIGHGRGLYFYAKDLYNTLYTIPLFEKNLKSIISQITDYSERENKKNIVLILALSLLIIVLYFFLVKGRFIIKKVKTVELETKEMSKFLLRVKELEREKIALDIHDVLVQKLSDVKRNIENLKNFLPKDQFENIETSMFETIQTARNISFVLRPVEMQEDFAASIKYYCAEIAWRNSIAVNCAVSGFLNISLDKDIEINIFRIVQEALTNIVKHSKADAADVNILYSHPFVIVYIADNGIGINEDVLKTIESIYSSAEHMGLKGIRERVKMLNGKFSIKSGAGCGTAISIKLKNSV